MLSSCGDQTVQTIYGSTGTSEFWSEKTKMELCGLVDVALLVGGRDLPVKHGGA